MITLHDQAYAKIVQLFSQSKVPLHLDLPELLQIDLTPFQNERILLWNSNSFYEAEDDSDVSLILNSSTFDNHIKSFSNEVKAALTKTSAPVETNLGVFKVVTRPALQGMNPQTQVPIHISAKSITVLTLSLNFLSDCQCETVVRSN
ncbi:MAG TPA: HU family DNA-binding protein [Bdellovibrio sp.]|nr:HU family DNA-binding protein [Bdellovibrio sp.]